MGGDFSAFFRDFDWMGLQRHLKVLGIFARLTYRDGRQGYIEDTPRSYATCVRSRHATVSSRPLRAARPNRGCRTASEPPR